MVQILGLRHGEKDGDKLTISGENQVLAAGHRLLSQGFCFDRLIHSGANRTRRSLEILITAMKIFHLPLEENENFSYNVGKNFHASREEFAAEMEKIQQAGGTLDIALRLSKYAQEVRRYIYGSIIDLGREMESKSQKSALVFSHSPLIVTAAPVPEETPYGLYECDGILYTYERGKIKKSEIIRAPIRGKTLW
ncbi:MAG: hypothetical protein NTZ49_04715 [Candidatus Parcubacteria bacterium]|nr:hypothetical protein [Candidatus Parcubacteria bacterium]